MSSLLKDLVYCFGSEDLPWQRLLLMPQQALIEDVQGKITPVQLPKPYYSLLKEAFAQTHSNFLVCNESQSLAFQSAANTISVLLPPKPISISHPVENYLKQQLQLQRNILLIGRFWPSLRVALHLTQTHGFPCYLTQLPLSFPHWPGICSHIESISELTSLSPDAIIVDSSNMKRLVQVMTQYTQVIGLLPASSLERALIRFERATGKNIHSSSLHVLSAIDVIGCIHPHPQHTRIEPLAEIVLTDQGYRPKILSLSSPMVPEQQKKIQPKPKSAFPNRLVQRPNTMHSSVDLEESDINDAELGWEITHLQASAMPTPNFHEPTNEHYPKHLHESEDTQHANEDPSIPLLEADETLASPLSFGPPPAPPSLNKKS